MEGNQNGSVPDGGSQASFGHYDQSGGQMPKGPRSRKGLLLAVAIIVVIAIVGAVLLLKLGGTKDNSSSGAKPSGGDQAAATKLFDALGKAAAQQNIKVAQLRKTYATKADLASDTDPGFIQSSVGEVVSQKFRGLYAQRLYDKETFNMQRCIDGTPYVDGLGAAATRQAPKSLAEANEYLKQMYRTGSPDFTVCTNIGMLPNASPDIAQVRLSDGLLPITLSEQQAANWKNKVQAANLFAVKDEGMVAHAGKQLHKYSFAPHGDGEGVNTALYNIFYEAGEIDKIKRDLPGAKWEYEFITVNPAHVGGVQGFYLLDDATGLPVYSELQGINQDRTKERPVARANLGFNKQNFTYPTAPTVELTTPLEFLQ
jgi:hypothetical protein